MHFEEASQQHTRRVREMWPRSALDLRQVRLAESSAQFRLECPRQVLLRHLAAEAAERAFNQAQIAKFFAELHFVSYPISSGFIVYPAYYDLQLSYCNL